MTFKEFINESNYVIDDMIEIITGEAGKLDVKAQMIIDEYFDNRFYSSEMYEPDEDMFYYIDKFMDDKDIKKLFKQIEKYIK